MKNVLILDDDAAFVQTMSASLDASRYTTVSAGNGEEGLEKMKTFKPDVILLDIKMPKMDGLEFLKKVNEQYGMGKTPVIITSNLSSLEHISEGMELGIRGYIIKSTESLQNIVSIIDKELNK